MSPDDNEPPVYMHWDENVEKIVAPGDQSAAVAVGYAVRVYEGSYTKRRLDEAFGPASDGVWRADDGPGYLLRGERLYETNWYEYEDVARAYLAAADHLAGESDDARRLVELLSKEDGVYQITVSVGADVPLPYLDENEVSGFGTDLPLVTAWGDGLGVESGEPVLTIALLHDSQAEAEKSIRGLEDSLQRNAERSGVGIGWDIFLREDVLLAKVRLQDSSSVLDLTTVLNVM